MTIRTNRLQELIDQVADLEARLHRAQSDLQDQNDLRAKWKSQAEKAEDAQVSPFCFHVTANFVSYRILDVRCAFSTYDTTSRALPTSPFLLERPGVPHTSRTDKFSITRAVTCSF
jgi:hypothetical protein